MICSSVKRLGFMVHPQSEVMDSTHSWRNWRGSGHDPWITFALKAAALIVPRLLRLDDEHIRGGVANEAPPEALADIGEARETRGP